MECNSWWYGLELHSGNHNKCSGHTIVGKKAYVVPLGLGPSTNFEAILATILYMKHGLDQDKSFLEQVEISSCYQNYLIKIKVQNEHYLFDNLEVEHVRDYWWNRKVDSNTKHVPYIIDW